MLTVFLCPSESRAELTESIDLTMMTPYIKVQSQADFRWGGFPVGPDAAQFKTDDTGMQVNLGRCGMPPHLALHRRGA